MRSGESTEDQSKSWAFLDSLIENLPNMVFVKEANELRFVRFNRAGEELLGYPRDALLGKNDYDFFPRDQADAFTRKDRDVLLGRSVVDIQSEPIETRTRGVRYLHTKKIPLFDASGNPQYLLGISEDITDQHQASLERERILREEASLEEREIASRRLSFLAECSTRLSSTLDYHLTIRQLAELATRFLSDWTTITMAKDSGSPARLVALHKDPARRPLMDRLMKGFPVTEERLIPLTDVIEAGRSLFYPVVSKRDIQEVIRDEEHANLILDLGCASSMTVAIATGGKIFGALSFNRSTPGKPYTESDLAIAEEMGRRAGIACEHALLYEAAKQAVQIRDDFLSIASHELKTPITSLQLQLQLVHRKVQRAAIKDPLLAEVQKIMESSVRGVRRLTSLVDDLLDVSRIQAGRLTYHFESVDLADIIQETIGHSANPSLVSTHLETVMVDCDPFRMEQVITNLLSNAIKYGMGNPIAVSLRSEGKQAVVKVSDGGVGIPPNLHQKIFERFERGCQDENISGLGLGLYIADSIIRSHQGEIRVQSSPGEGTTFEILLPLIHTA